MINEKLRKELTEIIKQSPVKNELQHAEATLKWLLHTKPDADLALQVAAFGHDIDRAISKITNKDLKDMSNYQKDREEHSQRSAQYLTAILVKNKYDTRLVDRVGDLVKNHEVGGDKDSDLLRDADSIAYFEFNIPTYLERNGEEKTRHKIHFMFDRASERAQDIIKGLKLTDKSARKLMAEEIL
jgi:hypothetical protein